jgi:hypothetical protein
VATKQDWHLAMVRTARLEQECFGAVLSASVAAHVDACGRCRFIETSDYRALSRYRRGIPEPVPADKHTT